jgi:hypothetical protein
MDEGGARGRDSRGIASRRGGNVKRRLPLTPSLSPLRGARETSAQRIAPIKHTLAPQQGERERDGPQPSRHYVGRGRQARSGSLQ